MRHRLIAAALIAGLAAGWALAQTVTYVTLTVRVEQDTSWPAVWRAVALATATDTSGMTAPQKRRMVQRWCKDRLRELAAERARQDRGAVAQAEADAGALVLDGDQ